MINKNALELIGNTPLMELSKIHKGPGRILVKAEFLQPGGSVKDRAAKKIIELAYKNGKLKKGQPVVEMTSGNMGAGLAIVCNILGNPLIVVMSEGNSPERAKMLKNMAVQSKIRRRLKIRQFSIDNVSLETVSEFSIRWLAEVPPSDPLQALSSNNQPFKRK